MLPEEKLQRQSAKTRNQSQNKKAKNYKQISDTNATVIGYSAPTGQNIIQLQGGSISYAASDTNGATSLGDNVPLHSGTMRVDGLPYIKKQPVVVKKQPLPKVTYPVKVLFSVVNEESGTTDFYIGGDRASPDKIFTLATTKYVYGYLANTGIKLTDWIMAIEVTSLPNQTEAIDGIYIVTPNLNWHYSYSTDIVPTYQVSPRPDEYTVWEVSWLGNGQVTVIVRPINEGGQDAYYIYKDTISHFNVTNDASNGNIYYRYPLPNNESVDYLAYLTSPLPKEFIALSAVDGTVKYVTYADNLFNETTINYNDIPPISNRQDRTLINRTVYQALDPLENVRATDITIELLNYKISATGQINQLKNLKTKVFNLNSLSAEIYTYSYFPPK